MALELGAGPAVCFFQRRNVEVEISQVQEETQELATTFKENQRTQVLTNQVKTSKQKQQNPRPFRSLKAPFLSANFPPQEVVEQNVALRKALRQLEATSGVTVVDVR